MIIEEKLKTYLVYKYTLPVIASVVHTVQLSECPLVLPCYSGPCNKLIALLDLNHTLNHRLDQANLVQY